MTEKQLKFIDLYHVARKLIESNGEKLIPGKFNEYLTKLPSDKAKTMQEIRDYSIC